MKTPPVSTTNKQINNFNSTQNQTDSEKLKLLKKIEKLKNALTQQSELNKSLQSKVKELKIKNEELSQRTNSIENTASIIHCTGVHILNNNLSKETKMLRDKLESFSLDPLYTLSLHGKPVPKDNDES